MCPQQRGETHPSMGAMGMILSCIWWWITSLEECGIPLHCHYSVTLWVASVSVCMGASQRTPLSVLARNLHKGLAREISHETGRTREGRSQRSVGRRGQSREGQSAEETSRQNRVRRWESGREETSQQKSALQGALWEFSLEYTFALAHRMHKKCYRLPPLGLGANPRPIICSSFLPPSRLHFAYP